MSHQHSKGIFFNFILLSLFIHFEAVILLLLSAIAESPLRRADEATCLWMVLHCTVWWRAALFLLAMAVNSLHVPFSLHVFPPLPSFFFHVFPQQLARSFLHPVPISNSATRWTYSHDLPWLVRFKHSDPAVWSWVVRINKAHLHVVSV